ncbi:alpha-1,3-arabinosyltransferase XAT3-like [Zingiber officinale]|uniref:Glycosyltransferase 61 catalytic domain-containing protein n=1 Tax=Zingiber officinale TaxID=94328 RepID=A0A8J5HYI7_ZINOF|nr:alpha-1,3-arabinosyltransferase XAT3-like [Zingiber officinale]KAG6534407.1 hypothetical protein ZIOFF_008293 [Zingiber officinale]
MKLSDSFNHGKAGKMSYVTLWVCLLIAVTLLCLIKSGFNTAGALTLQISIWSNVLSTGQLNNTERQVGAKSPTFSFEDAQVSDTPNEDEQLPVGDVGVTCDYTGADSDTCWIAGDIRVLTNSSTIMVASPLADQFSPSQNTTWKIRPYTRKQEVTTQKLVRELTVALTSQPPRCTVNRSTVPALFFSTGGFIGNYFHDFTDVIIPLFMTARRFNGSVQFVVVDFSAAFMEKYRPILERLSDHPVIDMDGADDAVRCFSHAHVGLLSHKVLGIDSSSSPDGVSVHDFRDFLRACFSLKRNFSSPSSKPRLLLILRKGPRSFVNEAEVVNTAGSLGFELISTTPEDADNLSLFARIVNSADVLVGVHGAGLTNMLFLPDHATLLQIVPCCGMAMTAGNRYLFAEPALDMGLRYVDYEISEEESSLIDMYPRGGAVFKDPASIQKEQGFVAFWNIYLNQQKVKLDVERFRSKLLDVLHSIKN